MTGTRNAGGQDWELRDTGKGEKSMVLAYRGTTVILAGTRSWTSSPSWPPPS